MFIQVLCLFLLSFFVSEIRGINKPKLASENKPIHIVILTRNQKYGGFYLPITVSEAVKVFSVVNYFLGETSKSFKEYIDKAFSFDQLMFN